LLMTRADPALPGVLPETTGRWTISYRVGAAALRDCGFRAPCVEAAATVADIEDHPALLRPQGRGIRRTVLSMLVGKGDGAEMWRPGVGNG